MKSILFWLTFTSLFLYACDKKPSLIVFNSPVYRFMKLESPTDTTWEEANHKEASIITIDTTAWKISIRDSRDTSLFDIFKVEHNHLGEGEFSIKEDFYKCSNQYTEQCTILVTYTSEKVNTVVVKYYLRSYVYFADEKTLNGLYGNGQ